MTEQTRIEELERLLREAELRVEASDRRAEASDLRIQAAELRIQAAEEKTRHTTLDEYIEACHRLLFSTLKVQTNTTLSSTGSITNPRNTPCPTSLQPWPDFIEQQRVIAGMLHQAIPAEMRLFDSQIFLSGLGNRISQRQIHSNNHLKSFFYSCVDNPVRAIMHQLKKLGQVQEGFGIGDGVIFGNHRSAVSDVAEEAVVSDMSSPPTTPDQGRISNQLGTDQICVYPSENRQSTRRSRSYVCDYKAPHKLTAQHLRAGLRPMNVYKEVINRRTIPTSADPVGRFQYHAERLSAAAISPTYHCMIKGGLDYGLLTTGEAIVFLKLDWKDPQTLYYHLAEPGPEVAAHPNHFHSCTAVSQYLAFTLIALGQLGQRREHGQEERHLAIQGLKGWAEDFESMLRSIPASERTLPSCGSLYKSTTYGDIDRSPYPFRHEGRPVGDKNPPDKIPTRRDSPGPSDDESGGNLPDTPSAAERRARGRKQATRRSQRIQAQQTRGAASGGGTEHTRKYCTQKCLLGLVNGGLLDWSCPNITLHTGRPGSVRGASLARHPVDHDKWLQLMRKQLEESLDNGITPLCQGGARGVLFQVTLLAYGYTFVSKGTVRAFIKDLEHEAAVYARLKPLQGINVPVFLGAVDLRPMNKIYYYDHRVYVVHLTFLSWGGYDLRDIGVDGSGKRLADGVVQSLRSIHEHGVVHKDVREANMLFNPESNRVMMIDFERSLIVQPPRRALAQVVPNKPAGNHEMAEKGNKGRGSPDYREDLLEAESVFYALNWSRD